MKRLNNKYCKYILLFVIIAITNFIIFEFLSFDISSSMILEYMVEKTEDETHQVFLGSENEWSEENSVKGVYSKKDNLTKISFKLPKDTETIRLDLGNEVGMIKLSNINIRYFYHRVNIEDEIANITKRSHIEEIYKKTDGVEVQVIGDDPFVILNFETIDINNLFKIDTYIDYCVKVLLGIFISMAILLCVKNRKSIIGLIVEIYKAKNILWNLSKNDFKTRYAGSYLGIFWAFVQPVITVLIYWFVFQVGFRSAPIENFPFVLWLISGIVPWFFFSEALMNATGSLLEYSYLVKKLVFKISILPVVKIISALFVHVFFVVFTILIFALNGYKPNIYMLQMVYYSICALFLALSLSFATSAMVLFFKDLGQIINISMQIGIWMTPIMWNYTMIPVKYLWLFKLNPMYYVVEGYRDTLINQVWFWERFNQTIYFWSITTALFFIGIVIFKKLKPHFSDVL